MTPERFQQIEELYHAVRERSPEDRAALLTRADPELRREVELLLSQPSGVMFLDRPAILAAAQLLDDSTVTMLAMGTCLGPYRIESKLGEGGMGKVYRAVDTRLGRAVAIKVAHRQFSERFEREARAIAALNHPHICTLYDVGPNYLVMELVEGETLANRLRKEPLPMELVARYGVEIADALAAAHAHGIIHRDLKPSNIMLTKAGVKVLDFGLAKFEYSAGAIRESETTLTEDHAILGTPAYMAPERLAGEGCDARGDIFALGLVLYEMAASKPAFAGKDRAALIAEVARCDPAPLENAPWQFRRVVERCLQKDPEERWQSARDVKLELEWIARAPAEGAPEPVTASRWNVLPWMAIAAVLAIALIAVTWIAWRATRPVDHPLTRLSVDLGPEAMTGLNLTVAISPDGRRLVYPARGADGKQQLATRLLDQARPSLLPGTENGSDPFFYPDGQWIGFFASGILKKISVQGGAPVTLNNGMGAALMGASWGQDGNIIAAMGNLLALSRIPAAGGPAQPLTSLGTGEVSHRWPQILPGGGAVLFTASPSTARYDNANIEIVSLKTGQVKVVQRGGYYGRYLPSGHLVYLHQGVLFGVGFDPARLETRGAPVLLLEDVAANPVTGGGQFDFSSTGTFVYAAGKSAAQAWQVAWLDSSGKMQPLLATPGVYAYPRFSPDGRKLAFINDSDIYIHDVERDTTSRLTFTGDAGPPVWAPDGEHIVFLSFGNRFSFSWVRSDGAGEPQQVFKSPINVSAWSFSPDGWRLAYQERNVDTGQDLWTLPLDITDPDHPKPGKPEPFLRTPADETIPKFSPDGRWIAYRSNESGNVQIYVRPFPARSGGRWQISTGGGLYAFWSNNGRELFYETADNRIMVVDYTVNGDSFVPSKPRLWVDRQLFYAGSAHLDLAPDGKRFAVLALPEAAPGEKGSVHVTMLLNFFDELRRRIP